MLCLLMDVGSTFIKYCVYDTVTGEERQKNSIPFPPPCFAEGTVFRVSLAEIDDRVKQILCEAAALRADAVFISVQMHGYVLRDTAGHFDDYVSWRDQSGNAADARFDGVDFDARGTARKSNLPFVKLAYGDVEGEFFTLGSYLAFLLTGRNATHLTDACASGFFLADTGECAQDTRLTLPQAHSRVCALGEYEGMRVYTPMGDHQVSFHGSGAGQAAYLLNVGTATQLSCLQVGNTPVGAFEKRPYLYPARLCTVSGLVGGGRLYEGEGHEELLAQVLGAMDRLPPKKELLLGGGGAGVVLPLFEEKLKGKGIVCRLVSGDVGTEGLKMIAKENSVRAGTMLSEIAFPNFPVLCKNSGLDFVILDNEHGYFDCTQIAALTVQANLVGLEWIVRIGDSSRGHVTKLADMGVQGFLLPMTSSVTDIQRVIDYAKYPPVGKRGVSTTRAHTLYDPPALADYMVEANEKMKIYAQIETVEGVQNVEDILALPAVTGALIGPNDLSVDMGCIGKKEPIKEAIRRIGAAAVAKGKPFGIITGDKELICVARECGASMFSVGSELNMLINGCKKIKEDIKNG